MRIVPNGVVFIAVNYRTTEAALHFARRIEAARTDASVDIGLVLVDNTDGTGVGELGKSLRLESIGSLFLEGAGNLGYFGGARHGLKAMRHAGWDPDWIVVSNVDLDFDPKAFADILRNQDPTAVGIVAPRVRSSLTLRELNPYLAIRPSAMRMQMYKWIFRQHPTMLAYEWLAQAAARLLRPFRGNQNNRKHVGHSIYAPHGSIIVFSREFFKRGGTLDHTPFLFGEEISVAEAARHGNLPVQYVPEIEVIHSEHASIGALPSRRIQGFLRESSAYCADRFFPLR